jgi:hypothetical protein
MKKNELVEKLRALIAQATASKTGSTLDFSVFESELRSLGVEIQIIKVPKTIPSISYSIDGQRISGYHLGQNSRFMLSGLQLCFGINLPEDLLQIVPACSKNTEPKESQPLRVTESQREYLKRVAATAGRSVNSYIVSLIDRDRAMQQGNTAKHG